MECNNHNDNILNQVGRSTDFSDQTPNSSSGTTAPAEMVSDENEDESSWMMPMAICSFKKLMVMTNMMAKGVDKYVEE